MKYAYHQDEYSLDMEKNKIFTEKVKSSKSSSQRIQELLKRGESIVGKVLITAVILGALSTGVILDNNINVKNIDYVNSDPIAHNASGILKTDVERFAFFIKECEISDNGIVWNQVFFQSLTPQIRSQIQIIASDVKFLRSLRMFEISPKTYAYFLTTYTEDFMMFGVPGVGFEAYKLAKTYKNPNSMQKNLQR